MPKRKNKLSLAQFQQYKEQLRTQFDDPLRLSVIDALYIKSNFISVNYERLNRAVGKHEELVERFQRLTGDGLSVELELAMKDVLDAIGVAITSDGEQVNNSSLLSR